MLVSAACPFIQLQSSFKSMLLMEEKSQGVYVGRRVGVLVPLRLLSSHKRSPSHHLCRLVLTLANVRGCSHPSILLLVGHCHIAILLAAS